MNLHNFQIKIAMSRGADVPYETWHRVFNRWIPEPDDDILVDVADYSHVHQGPVAVLVGHNANYAIDNTLGRLGFAYTRKRPLDGSLPDRLVAVFRKALSACRRLEGDPLLQGKVAFRAEEIEILVNDRLQAPNTGQTLAELRPALDGGFRRLFGKVPYAIAHDADPRRRFNLSARASQPVGASQLLENLER